MYSRAAAPPPACASGDHLIRLNEALQIDNAGLRVDATELRREVASLEHRAEELEDQLARDERAKVVTKGLLHNFIEIDRLRQSLLALRRRQCELERQAQRHERVGAASVLMALSYTAAVLIVASAGPPPSELGWMYLLFLACAARYVATRGERRAVAAALGQARADAAELEGAVDSLAAPQQYLHEHVDGL